MIKATDLRIGNWVINKHNETQQIFNLNDDGMRIHYKPTVSVNCNPIPLTTEILLKCGFKEIGFDIYTKQLFENIYLQFEACKIGIKNSAGYIGITGLEITHLHELQNLFHSLTQKELEITL